MTRTKTRTRTRTRTKTKTKKRTHKQGKTKVLLELLTSVKTYHWTTTSFAEHKATDELYSSLNDLIDTFVEAQFGYQCAKTQTKTKTKTKNIGQMTLTVSPCSKRAFVHKLTTYLRVLREWTLPSELANIRDEILSAIDKTLYLFTFE